MAIAGLGTTNKDNREVAEPESIARVSFVIQLRVRLDHDGDSVEQVRVVGGLVKRSKLQVVSSDGINVGVSLDDGAQDDAESRTTATESLEQISVVAVVGDDDASIGQHDLGLENLISTKTVVARRRTVATTRWPTAGGTGRNRAAANDDDIVLPGNLVDIPPLPRAVNVNGTASPARLAALIRGSILLLEVNAVAEVTQPNLQATVSIRSTEQVMARAGDGDADIVKSSKQQSREDVITTGGVHGVRGRLAQGAGGGLLAGGIVNGRTGDVVRIRSADGLFGLEVLIGPHLVDVRALVEVLVRAIVAGFGDGFRFDELVANEEVECFPFKITRPALVTRNLYR